MSAILANEICLNQPIHVDTISIELSLIYFKGLVFKIAKKWFTSVPEYCFYPSKQCRL